MTIFDLVAGEQIGCFWLVIDFLCLQRLLAAAFCNRLLLNYLLVVSDVDPDDEFIEPDKPTQLVKFEKMQIKVDTNDKSKCIGSAYLQETYPTSRRISSYNSIPKRFKGKLHDIVHSYHSLPC
ncbi:hypothetical protein MTR_1g097500 [Medicago truncatula]|uniref:Uncharacterized protein n=1 Tax=Medicago truncatula TaxID=3880 RepID=A0A072VQC6_MEDTR|nr:hypothetical protein MTR_1g097500 [Medicago truncatula]